MEQLTAVNRGSVNRDTEALFCSELKDFGTWMLKLTDYFQLINGG